MDANDPQQQLRIGIWWIDLPGSGERDDAGLQQLIATFLGAGNEVVLVAEAWQHPAQPRLEVKVASFHARGSPIVAALLATYSRLRRVKGRIRRRVALASRAWLLLLIPLAPLGVLLLLARLLYPLVSRVVRRVLDRPRREAERVASILVSEARCDVWLALSASSTFPFGSGVRCVWLVDGPPDRAVMPCFDDDETVSWFNARLQTVVQNATLFLVHSPEVLTRPDLSGWDLLHERLRVIPVGEPHAWLPILAEAAALPLSGKGLIAPVASNRPPHVHLILPYPYQGGVWEAVRTLLPGLVEVNRRRGNLLRITLAFPPGQLGIDELIAEVPELTIEWLSSQLFPAKDGGTQALLWSLSALRADAWFLLVDRVRHPLVAVRPFGFMVYDVIQKYIPEMFPATFHREFLPSMRATVSRSDRVITTNPVTRLDVAAEYGLSSDRVALVPVACEPGTKFEGMAPRRVPVPQKFLLNVTNPSPHKGMAVVLRAYARLKARLGGRGPGLVFCGVNTERIAPSYNGPVDDVVWRRPRELVSALGLVQGEDVWFLGHIDDAQLRDLYERCSAVINAARFDNGTFSLLEARYFGKPVICSRYPAAVALYDRFEIPIDYFDLEDDQGLVEAMHRAINQPALAGADLDRCRTALADPKFSHRRHAEQVYDVLLDMARRARETTRQAA
jgi:glycosyltransferase involved in cell wall biosynthesis